MPKLSFALALVVSCCLLASVSVEAKKKSSPEHVCETCQIMVWDAVAKVKALPKARVGLDVQIMGILDQQCSSLQEFADKADIPANQVQTACAYLMDAGLESDLEEQLDRETDEEALRKKICQKKSKKKRYCNKLWAEDELPSNRKSPSERNLEAAEAFLASNKEKEGVTALASGLQYKVLEKGTGEIKPQLSEQVVCHYQGTLESGEEFDSSYSRGEPSSFAPSQVIKAWTESLQMMVKGDIWELYVHPDLGYGKSGSGAKIGPNALLIFKIEMLGVKGKDDDETLKAKASSEAVDGENKEEL